MVGQGLSVGPGALLLAAFLYYAGGGAALAAFLTAALAHELGHLAAIVLTGAEMDRVSFTAAGPVLGFHGALSLRQEMGVAAAGPAAGLVFASACAALDTPYFRYAGLIALLSSAFNLLPALPLDGGRLALAALRTSISESDARQILRVSGLVCGLCAAVTGAFLRSIWAFGVGIWLAVLADRDDLR